MEKSSYNAPYPQTPAGMNPVGASSSMSGQHAEAAPPPTYEQATQPTSYPPVQVLPSPAPATLNRPPPTPQSPSTQVFVGAVPSGQYVGVSVGGGVGGGDGGGSAGGNVGWSVPQPTSYPIQQQGVPMVQQPLVIVQQQALLPLGAVPVYIVCPTCHIQKLTRIEHVPCGRTHLMAAILCVLGLWCCACLPYCIEDCMNTNHYCGNCNKFLGTYTGSW